MLDDQEPLTLILDSGLVVDCEESAVNYEAGHQGEESIMKFQKPPVCIPGGRIEFLGCLCSTKFKSNTIIRIVLKGE